MKKNLSENTKPSLFLHDYLFRAAGALLFLTMLSIWLVSGLYAKYTVSESVYQFARVAEGLPTVTVSEHEAVQISDSEIDFSKNTLHKLTDTVVSENTYKNVLPGVYIPKDPYITIGENSNEVDFDLYLKVTEKSLPTYKKDTDTSSDEPSKAVTYDLLDVWEYDESLSDEENGIYVYKYTDPTKNIINTNVQILKDNAIYVSEHCDVEKIDPNGFSLVFSAWIEQID